jgi:tetratricopeptide (TPR) repeat protein
VTYPPSTLADLRTRITGLLSKMRALADPAGPGEALLAALAEAEAGGSAAAFTDSARVLANVIGELQGQLGEVLTQAEKIEPRQRRDALESEAYWLELKETLRQAAIRSADALRTAWLRSFAEALAAWRLDVCERLTREDVPDAEKLEEMRRTFSAAVTALQAREHAAALPAIELLVEEPPVRSPGSLLNEASRAAAFLVLGRIRLRDTADKAASLACFERAREAAPQDGRVHAALAEYYRATDDDATARDLSRRAIALSPDRPDGYVSMALSCEAQGWWDEVSEWHAQAVEATLRRATSGNPLGELGQLLAPVSGALYLRLGQAIRQSNPAAALVAAEKAIELGVNGEGKYPQRAAYQLKGDVLEVLQRPAEAAEALSAAAQHSAWDNDAETALHLYGRVSELDPKRVSNYWRWADALLTASRLPKPPYVDKEKTSQSLEMWDLGAKVAVPDYDHYWVYLTRAMIAQQLARFPRADRTQHYWEVLAFVEQSLLLNPARALAWVIMGQTHHALGNDLNALHATETALLCDPEDIDAIEQRIILLTNLKRHAEALSLLMKRRAMSPPAMAWVNAVEAHIVIEQFPATAGLNDCEAALAALDASPDWETPWSSIDRARLLRALGRSTEASEQYKKLWGSFDEQDVEQHLSYAWAAMMIGDVSDLNVALRILTDSPRDRVSGEASIERYLGFCRLLLGEDALARDHFDRAIAIASTARELDAWLGEDLEAEEMLETLLGRPQAGAAREILDRCKVAALERRAALQLPAKPEQELKWLIAAPRAGNEIDGWDWIAVQAATARFDLEARHWREAEETYRALQRYPEAFHTAQHGLEQALYGLALEGGGAESDALPGDRMRLAHIHGQRVDLERRRSPFRLFGSAGMQRIPVVTSIAIEAAGNLRHLLEGPEFAQELRHLRQGVDNLLGFTIPSVRVRVNESDLPDGTYIIILKEVPLVSGNLDLTRGLCNEIVDRLALLGVKGKEAVNPANGSECAWVHHDDWQRMKDAGFLIWTPAQYTCCTFSP